MAQEMRKSLEDEIKNGGESSENISVNSNTNKKNNNNVTSGFKFNAHAAEFIPRSYSGGNNNEYVYSPTNQMGLSTGYFYPCVQFLQDSTAGGDQVVAGTTTGDWFYVNPSISTTSPSNSNSNSNNNNNNNNDRDDSNNSNVINNVNVNDNVNIVNSNNNNNDDGGNNKNNSNVVQTTHIVCTSPSSSSSHPNGSQSSVSDDLKQKIIKQAEYLFSDLSLMANDTMAKNVSKDPEGYVPIPVIASMKKIKALATDNHLLVQSLRSSNKLVVSKDNKKVKRRNPFTETYKDELQSRTVMVENLPDDHSYQNLEKIFCVVGNVKAIRLCHPPEASPSSRSKSDHIISNKLHALVEYENSEVAEKTAEKLNDERNWRRGMRVRVMSRCSPKSVLKTRKSDFDMLTDDDDLSCGGTPNEFSSQQNAAEFVTENVVGEETTGGSRSSKASPRGRCKTKGRAQSHNERGLLSSPTHSIGALHCDTLTSKPSFKGPRMPDGTRGFTMGRGKPVSACSSPTSPRVE